MEKIDRILNSSQETNHPGHSLNSRRETRKCQTCGTEFSITTYDGDIKDYSQCKPCERRPESLIELKERIKEQRCLWEEQANIPLKFATKGLSDFDKILQPKAFKAVNEYDWHFNDEKPVKSLVFLSPGLFGCGKTHLVCGLLNKIIESDEPAYLNSDCFVRTRRCPVYFTTETLLLSRIRNTYNHRENEESETEEGIYSKLNKSDLLVIDDVGKVRPKDYGFLQGVYFRIIDDRYTNEQPIILTTNLDYTELEAHIGGACADRLREMCGKDGFVKMTGKSYRLK